MTTVRQHARNRKILRPFIPAPDSYWDIEPERMEKNPGGYVGETDEKEQEKLLIGLLRYGCDDNWTWSQTEKSPEVHLRGVNFHTALFHPNWSGDTAGLKGTRILNNGRHFWEMYISNRIFGTSIMFGIGTKMARVHADTFINLVGEDRHSWGLSHKGLLWHNGKYFEYTKPFSENRETKIGVFFDGIAGTLTYYKDGECLGVAFRGLQDIKEPLFPIISSSAAKTEITLRIMKRDFVNLQDRCRSVIVEHFKNKNDLDKLMLPSRITSYLEEGITANIPNNYKPWRRYMSINKNKIFLFG